MGEVGGAAVREPSIKGVIVHGTVEELRRHLERGAIRMEELEARLEKEDLELLEGPDDPVRWRVERPRPDLVIYLMDRSYD
jgi:hypothetical protein